MIFGCRTIENETPHEAGRALLADLYRDMTGRDLPPIVTAERGKPYFPGSSIHFSITHTPHHAFCVLSRKNVAIDAEEADRKINLRLAEKILSPEEKRQFDAAENQKAALLKFWVLKEACEFLLPNAGTEL